MSLNLNECISQRKTGTQMNARTPSGPRKSNTPTHTQPIRWPNTNPPATSSSQSEKWKRSRERDDYRGSQLNCCFTSGPLFFTLVTNTSFVQFFRLWNEKGVPNLICSFWCCCYCKFNCLPKTASNVKVTHVEGHASRRVGAGPPSGLKTDPQPARSPSECWTHTVQISPMDYMAAFLSSHTNDLCIVAIRNAVL